MTTRAPQLRVNKVAKGSHRPMPLGILMIFPSLGLIAALFILPIGIALRDSFFNVNTISGDRIWVGLSNFAWVLTSADIREAFLRSLIYCIVSVGCEVTLAVLISNLLRTRFRGQGFVRALIIAPYVIPTLIVVLIWRFLLEPSLGVLNLMLKQFDLVQTTPAWLGDPGLAFPIAIVVTIWKYTPFMVILMTARLQSVPTELYEAVSIDGGGAWSRLRYVTVPWLAPVIGISVAVRAILSLNEFDLLYLLTGGGPQGSSTTVPLLVREEAFAALDSGRASAIAIAMAFFVLAVVAVIYLLIRRRQRKS